MLTLSIVAVTLAVLCVVCLLMLFYMMQTTRAELHLLRREVTTLSNHFTEFLTLARHYVINVVDK